MRNILLIILLSILSNVVFGQKGQKKVMIWEYSEYSDQFGVFDVYLPGVDTARIVGLIEHSNDTIYLKDLGDSVVTKYNGGGVVNVGPEGSGTAILNKPYLDAPGSIFVEIVDFTKPYEPIELADFNFIINDTIITSATFVPDDTVYQIENPGLNHYSFRIKNEVMESKSYTRSSLAPIRRKKRKTKEAYNPNWVHYLSYQVFYSINPRGLVIESYTGNKVSLALKEYHFVYIAP